MFNYIPIKLKLKNSHFNCKYRVALTENWAHLSNHCQKKILKINLFKKKKTHKIFSSKYFPGIICHILKYINGSVKLVSKYLFYKYFILVCSQN